MTAVAGALGGELDFGGDLGHLEFGHGDLGGHELHGLEGHELHGVAGHEVHGVATSYQNVHLESHNPVPVIVHKAEEHHDFGGGFEGLGLEEHGHGYGLHDFEGH